MAEQRALERAYLAEDDDIRRSGFGGGAERWVAERSPLVEGIHRSGSFLDVGCANGRLGRDVRDWAAQRGFRIETHGVDLGSGLVRLARLAAPDVAANHVAADAWVWEPDRRWTFVYALLDQAPRPLWCRWVDRLFGWVEPGGRLIVASYGSRSRSSAPEDVAHVLRRCGHDPVGSAVAGDPPVTRFAWVDRSC